MKKSLFVLIAIVLSFTFFTLYAHAAPIGTSIINGSDSTYVTSTTGSNTSITAGGTKEANFTALGTTAKWGGFYGHISGVVVLADADGDQMVNWTVGDVNGSFLYAANESSVTWPGTNIFGLADETIAPAYVQGSATDSYNNTFDQDTVAVVETPEYNLTIGTDYVRTQDGSGLSSYLYTYAVNSSNQIIFVSPVYGDVTGYKGVAVDYQMVVPVDGTTAETYFFWLELA